MSSDYLFDKKGEPDDEVRALEEALRPAGYVPKSFSPRSPMVTQSPLRQWAIAAALVLAVGGGAVGYSRMNEPSFDVVSTINMVARNSRLRAGSWLETGATETAKVRVANIGELTLSPDSRLRLINSGKTEHRMELTHGSLHARVIAPPRLFVVETPSAVAVDLGCAYTLEVLADKSTRLAVTSGQVELQGHNRKSIVPFGAEARSVPGAGPGLPVSLNASPSFRAALQRFGDQPAENGQLEALIAQAEAADAVTLFNLLPLIDASRRPLVLASLARFVAVPQTLTPESAGDLDSAPMLALWEKTLDARAELKL